MLASRIHLQELTDDFMPFATTESKGHAFEIRMKPVPGRRHFRAAVISRNKVDFANAYNTDGVLRASVTIQDPPGYLLFKCDMVDGKPNASRGFQSKFGVAPQPA